MVEETLLNIRTLKSHDAPVKKGGGKRKPAAFALFLLIQLLFLYNAGNGISEAGALPLIVSSEEDLPILLKAEVASERGAQAQAASKVYSGYYLLQLNYIPNDDEQKSLASKGIELMHYIPENSWYVKATNANVSGINGLLYFGNILPAYKISADLQNKKGKLNVSVLLFSNDTRTKNLIREKARVMLDSGNVMEIEIDSSKITEIANLYEVMWIDFMDTDPVDLNDSARSLMQVVDLHEPPHSLSGSNVTIAMWESGNVQPHPDYQGRVTIGDSWTKPSFHATAVAGVLAGDGSASHLWSGKLHQWKGFAPKSKVVSFRWWLGHNRASDTYKKATQNHKASISSNSWGYPSGCGSKDDYNWGTETVDYLARGMNSGRQHKKVLIVWGAGNNGKHCSQGNILRYGSAKNVVTVGSMTRSGQGHRIRGYSSVGPADDGRIKPDVMSEGRVRTTMHPKNYVLVQGTSFSTPIVSGISALIYEQHKRLFNNTEPLPSTVKALLIHGADWILPSGTLLKEPAYKRGWGTVNAAKSIATLMEAASSGGYDSPNSRNKLFGNISSNTTVYEGEIITNQSREWKVYASGSEDIEATLVWDDFPAKPYSSKTLVNDLDLVVIDPKGNRKYPWTLNASNTGQAASRNRPDRLNNVESVWIEDPKEGEYTIRVEYHKLPRPPQLFSLVVTNSQPNFISTWKTNLSGQSNSTSIKLPLVSSGNYNFTVHWGDGTRDKITLWNQTETTHNYNESGEYQVTIIGTIEGFNFNNSGDKNKIIDIKKWGQLKLGNAGRYFEGASNLNITAEDVDLTGATNLSSMFKGASSFNGDASRWDVSKVTSMNSILSGASSFNQDLSAWNTCKVTNHTDYDKNTSSWDDGRKPSFERGCLEGVTSTKPDGYYKSGEQISIEIAYSENVFVTGTPKLELDLGDANGTADYVSGSGTKKLVFRHTVSGGNTNDLGYKANNSLKLNGGSLKDSSNKDIPLTLPEPGGIGSLSYNKNIVIDTSPPQIRITESETGNNRIISAVDNEEFNTMDYRIQSGTDCSDHSGRIQYPEGTNITLSLIGHDRKHVCFWAADLAKNGASNTSSKILYEGDTFKSVWDTTKTSSGSSGSNQIRLPLTSNGTYNFTVYWGDGKSNRITVWNQSEATHTYSIRGVHTINIKGRIEGFRFNGGGDRKKLISIKNWSGLRLGNQGDYFNGASNLEEITAQDVNLSGTTRLNGIFLGASKFNSNLTSWDVSKVTHINSVFREASSFNGDVSNWNVSSVTNMNGAFEDAPSFNQNITSWDVSNVSFMYKMFSGASSFNQNLSQWNVCKVTFKHSFDENAGSWDSGNKPSWQSPCIENVTSLMPNGYYTAGDVIRITLDLNEGVEVNGTPNLELDLNGTGRNASYVSGSGKRILTFEYEVEPGDTADDLNYKTRNSLKLNGGSIKDYDNNSAQLLLPGPEGPDSLAGNKDIRVDATVPEITVTRQTPITSHTFSAVDNEENTSMKYFVQSGSECSDTPDPGSENYSEGINITFSNESYSGRHLCFWSEDLAGNTGKSAPADIIDQDMLFTSVWDTGMISSGSSGSNQIKLPLTNSGEYNFTVYWGDGTSDRITSWNQTETTHTYPEGGLKTIRISGKIDGFRFAGEGDKNKLINITNWGSLRLGNSGNHFQGASNLESINHSGVNLSDVTDMKAMFKDASRFNGDLTRWDVSAATNMKNMFNGASSFNRDLSGWDVSRVKDMNWMFAYASEFNRDLSGWNVCRVETRTDYDYGAWSWAADRKPDFGMDCSGVIPGPVSVTSDKPNGAYRAGEQINITVTFSGEVFVTGTPVLELDLDGTDKQAGYVSGSGTASLEFSYLIEDGDNSQHLNYKTAGSLKLNSGSIKDSFNSNAHLDLPRPNSSGSLAGSKNLTVDTAPPVITTIKSVPGTSQTFSAVDDEDNTSMKYLVQPGSDCSDAPDPGSENYSEGSILTFSNETYSGKHLCFWSEDPAGNTGKSVPSIIQVDRTHPEILNVSSDKPNGWYKTGEEIELKITFSENVHATGMPVLELNLKNKNGKANYSGGNGTPVLTFDYVVQSGDATSMLNYEGKDSLQLNSGTIKDASGNDANITLPDPNSSRSLAGSRNLTIDTAPPEITVTRQAPFTSQAFSAVDNEDNTSMKHLVQAGSDCPDTPGSNSQNYSEGSTLTFSNETYSGKHLCFWSEDPAGNTGKSLSVSIADLGMLFTSVWETSRTSSGSSGPGQIRLPLTSEGEYNFTIYWGDGNSDNITSWNQTETTHTYQNQGQKKISIDGKIDGFRFAGTGDREKIISITNWGSLRLGGSGNYFQGASNLESINHAGVNLSGVTDMKAMFKGASRFNGDLTRWDVSAATNMKNMFNGASSFNRDLSGWDVSRVKDMNWMFAYASDFNRDLSGWNVCRVETRTDYDYAAHSWDEDKKPDFSMDCSGVIPGPASVTSDKPDGAYGTGEEISITITFSDEVFVTGTPTLELDLGGPDRSAEYFSGSGTESLAFTYTVEEGDNSQDLNYKTEDSLKLNSGTIKDRLNDDASLTLPGTDSSGSLSANKNLRIDTARPRISITESGSGVSQTFSAVDDEDNTIMKYIVQTGSDCSDTQDPGSENYSEGSILTFSSETYSGRHLCFWSEDSAGNIGKATSLPITDFGQVFTSVWNTSKTSSGSSGPNQIMLPLTNSGKYNFTVYWGDGTSDAITSWNQTETAHTYPGQGVYELNTIGEIEGFSFNNKGDKEKLINITKWGSLRLGGSGHYFAGASNLESIPADANLSGTTTMVRAFWKASRFTGNISGWDVSEITSMKNMFNHASAFNQDLSSWNVSKVRNMDYMFGNMPSFNQDLSGWDVCSVETHEDFAGNSYAWEHANKPDFGADCS